MEGLIAGSTAGALTTLAMHPLDMAKIRMQVGRSPSLKHALRELAHGPLSQAYRGLTPNIVGNGMAWGCYFYLYEWMQHLLIRPDSKPGPHTYWACAFGAGILTQTVTNPIWVLKTQVLSTKRGEVGSPVNATDAALRLIKVDGIRGLWRGYTPGLLGTVQSSVYFSIYASLKPIVKQWFDSDMCSYFVASATAKTVAATLLYPHQVLRSRMQEGLIAKSLTVVAKKVYSTEGIKGFYRGLSANLVRVVPSMTITLVVYEITKKVYEDFRDGSADSQ